MRKCGHCLHKEGGSVVKAIWNALRGRHKYGATNGNQYAARRSSMITCLTRNSLTRVRVRWGAAIYSTLFTNNTLSTISTFSTLGPYISRITRAKSFTRKLLASSTRHVVSAPHERVTPHASRPYAVLNREPTASTLQH